jgi:hypothetical protein
MTTNEYYQFIDHLDRLQMAIYDACGPNVGPEEFDRYASQASRAIKALRGLPTAPHAADAKGRALKIAGQIFGTYI